eukprot:4063005-Pleurochrysis_carterae.AAC.2
MLRACPRSPNRSCCGELRASRASRTRAAGCRSRRRGAGRRQRLKHCAPDLFTLADGVQASGLDPSFTHVRRRAASDPPPGCLPAPGRTRSRRSSTLNWRSCPQPKSPRSPRLDRCSCRPCLPSPRPARLHHPQATSLLAVAQCEPCRLGRRSATFDTEGSSEYDELSSVGGQVHSAPPIPAQIWAHAASLTSDSSHTQPPPTLHSRPYSRLLSGLVGASAHLDLLSVSQVAGSAGGADSERCGFAPSPSVHPYTGSSASLLRLLPMKWNCGVSLWRSGLQRGRSSARQPNARAVCLLSLVRQIPDKCDASARVEWARTATVEAARARERAHSPPDIVALRMRVRSESRTSGASTRIRRPFRTRASLRSLSVRMLPEKEMEMMQNLAQRTSQQVSPRCASRRRRPAPLPPRTVAFSQQCVLPSSRTSVSPECVHCLGHG